MLKNKFKYNIINLQNDLQKKSKSNEMDFLIL